MIGVQTLLRTVSLHGLQDLAKEAARILMTIRDESKEKDISIEMGWVGEKTNGKHEVSWLLWACGRFLLKA